MFHDAMSHSSLVTVWRWRLERKGCSQQWTLRLSLGWTGHHTRGTMHVFSNNLTQRDTGSSKLKPKKTTWKMAEKQSHVPGQWHICQKFKYLSQMANSILRSEQSWLNLASHIHRVEVIYVHERIMLHILMLLLFCIMLLKHWYVCL